VAELSGLGHTAVSVEDTVAANNEAASSISKASNASASATITITMYAVAEEEWS